MPQYFNMAGQGPEPTPRGQTLGQTLTQFPDPASNPTLGPPAAPSPAEEELDARVAQHQAAAEALEMRAHEELTRRRRTRPGSSRRATGCWATWRGKSRPSRK